MNQLTPEQERLAEALRSFPKQISEESLKWPEGFRLYEALRRLPKEILDASGRFLYSDLSTLKPGRFYLLGYNPGGKPANHPIPLRDEIRQWRDKNMNAYFDEIWEESSCVPGGAYLQLSVKALLESLKPLIDKPQDVCASNLYYARSKNGGGQDSLEKWNDFSVHRAVLDIVMPSHIIAFGKATYDVIIRGSGINFKETAKFFIGNYRLKGRETKGYCYAAKGQYCNKFIKLIGLPHLTYYNPKDHPEYLPQIVEECSNTLIDVIYCNSQFNLTANPLKEE
jgi:hypothetical protein